MSRASILKPFQDMNREAASLLIFLFLSRLGLFMSVPYLAFYLTYLHYSPLIVGLVVGAQPLTYAVWSLMGGYLGDRYGKKLTMILAYFGMALGSLGMFYGHTVTAFFILNMFLGLARANFDASMPAYFTDVVPKESQRFMFNLRFIMINLAGAVGPLMGMYFANRHSLAIYLVSAMVYLGCALAMHYVLKDDRVFAEQSSQQRSTIQETFKAFKTDRALLYLVLGTGIYWMAYVQLEAPFAQVLLIRNPSEATWLYSLMWIINTMMIVVLQLPLVAWTKALSLKKLTVIGASLISLSFLGLALFTGEVAFISCIVILTIGEMMFSPVSNIIIAQISPPEMRSAYFGALSFGFLGSGIAPVFGGLLLEYGNSEILFLTMTFLTGLIIVFYLKSLQKEADVPEATDCLAD